MLRDSPYFGRIFEVRVEFGRWIFDGEHQRAAAPSWNYRKADGGGLDLDMFPHWRYMIEHFAGVTITAVNCICRTHVGRRRDEDGRPMRWTSKTRPLRTLSFRRRCDRFRSTAAGARGYAATMTTLPPRSRGERIGGGHRA